MDVSLWTVNNHDVNHETVNGYVTYVTLNGDNVNHDVNENHETVNGKY